MAKSHAQRQREYRQRKKAAEAAAAAETQLAAAEGREPRPGPPAPGAPPPPPDTMAIAAAAQSRLVTIFGRATVAVDRALAAAMREAEENNTTMALDDAMKVLKPYITAFGRVTASRMEHRDDTAQVVAVLARVLHHLPADEARNLRDELAQVVG